MAKSEPVLRATAAQALLSARHKSTCSGKEILFVAPSAYPLGGIATWLDYIVPGLRRCGWNVTLGLVEGQFHNVDAYLDVHPEDRTLRIPCRTGTPEGRIRQLVHTIANVRPDIIVSVNVADVIPAVNRARASSSCAPHVAMALHAVQPDLIASIRGRERILDAIVCTNRLTCALVETCTSVSPHRIHYAPYGVDVNGNAEKQRALDEVLRIGFVGRLERGQKRVEDIEKIVAELDRRDVHYELVIAGEGPDEEWLRRKLSDAGTGRKVCFLGGLTNLELAERVYNRVDVLLITSLWETGPIVAWEAMFEGVVVVTSAYIGSGREGSLKSGENCLIFPIGDAVAAVDCLQNIKNAELRARLLEGGFKLVSQRYTKEMSIQQWSASLSRILNEVSLAFHDNDPMYPAVGRLDRLFGREMGETIRGLLGRKYRHSEPGGEWPHALPSTIDDDAFWKMARTLDQKI